MNQDLQRLRKQHALFKSGMLIFIVLFAFALWLITTANPLGIPFTVAVCLLSLTVTPFLRRQYRNTYMRLKTVADVSATMRQPEYTHKEARPAQLLSQLNLTPGISYLENPVCRHIVKGTVDTIPASIEEVTFTCHPQKEAKFSAVTGTLIRFHIGGDLRFVVASGNAFPFQPDYQGYRKPDNQPIGNTELDVWIKGDASFPDSLARSIEELLEAYQGPVCIASGDEGISVLLPRYYYAYQPDYTHSPAENDFLPKTMPILSLTARVAMQYHNGQSSD